MAAFNATTMARKEDNRLQALARYYVEMSGTPVHAFLETALTGANNDLRFTAQAEGVVGQDVTIAYVDPGGNDAVLGVVVTDTDIVVNLATSGAGAITSTASLILAAVEADDAAYALVRVALAAGSTGAGVVTALTETALAGAATVIPGTATYFVSPERGATITGQAL